jgi:hypothetical protein
MIIYEDKSETKIKKFTTNEFQSNIPLKTDIKHASCTDCAVYRFSVCYTHYGYETCIRLHRTSIPCVKNVTHVIDILLYCLYTIRTQQKMILRSKMYMGIITQKRLPPRNVIIRPDRFHSTTLRDTFLFIYLHYRFDCTQ